MIPNSAGLSSANLLIFVADQLSFALNILFAAEACVDARDYFLEILFSANKYGGAGALRPP